MRQYRGEPLPPPLGGPMHQQASPRLGELLALLV
jgi:hypothetical protein